MRTKGQRSSHTGLLLTKPPPASPGLPRRAGVFLIRTKMPYGLVEVLFAKKKCIMVS